MSAHRGVLGVVLLFGCGGAAGQAEPQPCAPVSSELPHAASADLLAGEFRVRLVATSGEKRGSSTEGTLKLRPHLAEHRVPDGPGSTADTTHVYPFYGAADLDLAALGAVAPGDLESLDPLQPGVLVIERVSGPAGRPGRLLLRLGSEANRRGVLRFDGGYAALRVRHLDQEGFAGTWQSGVTMPAAGGHFCATRIHPAPG